MAEFDFFGHKLPAFVTDKDSENKQIESGNAFIKGVPVNVVRVSGPDSADYLNRRCCQKIIDMKDDEVRRSMILDAVGKIEHDFDILCQKAGEDFLLITTPFRGDQLTADVDKYLFAEDCSVEDLGVQKAVLVLSKTEKLDNFEAKTKFQSDLFGTLLLLDVASESHFTNVSESEIGIQTYLDHQLKSGHVFFGLDFNQENIPLEMNLERALHFDKGCYPGQEIIATITNLGHPSKKFVIVSTDSEIQIEDILTEDGKKAGEITHLNSSGNLAIGWVKWPHRQTGTQFVSTSGVKCSILGEVEQAKV